MDSTFLGVFAGLALKLEAGCLRLLDLSDDNRKALVDLGLDQMPSIQLLSGEAARDQRVERSDFLLLPGSDLRAAERPYDVVDRALLMLECHEDLCRLDQRNERKFRDVKQFLREDIARHGGGPPLAP